MQKLYANRILLLFFCVFCSLNIILVGQTKKEALYSKRKELLDDIKYTSKLLEHTKKKKGKTIQNIRLLNNKIERREELINLYKHQIKEITNIIHEKENRLNLLNDELIQQKKYYADFVYYAFKNKNDYTASVYLLASNTMNQFYMRRKYMDQLQEARKEKIFLINALSTQIDKEVVDLLKDKTDKQESIKLLNIERKKLFNEKLIREKHVSELLLQEKELKRQIREKRIIEEEIANKIEELIVEETRNNTFAKLTPEHRLIGENFEKNKGRLPWPTRQGIITEKFGKHRHPILQNVEVFNSGVDISTVEKGFVRVIFSGTVSKIFYIKGANYTVIVKHGNYYSVYNNLTDIKVNVGDRLESKDIIGTVSYDLHNGSSIVHLEIWKGLDKLNPEVWLSN